MTARERVARRQALLARFLDDDAFAEALRNEPGAAAAADVDAAFVQWLVSMDPARRASFRRSRHHKDALRRGDEKATGFIP